MYIHYVDIAGPSWRFSELHPTYQGCRALTFALARLSCYTSWVYSIIDCNWLL